jgi:hypothetical protein
MPLAARKLGQRRPADRFFVGAQDAAEVLQLACGEERERSFDLRYFG